jgi:hypothetical protein
VLRWVRERQPFFLLREERDDQGPVFVYAWRDDPEMLAWLLPWGAAVEVLEPARLRARLAEEARAMLARHTAPVAVPSPPPEPAAPPAERPPRRPSDRVPGGEDTN